MTTLLSILLSSFMYVEEPEMPEIPVILEEEVLEPKDYVEVPILMYHRIQVLKEGDGPQTRRFTVEPSMFARQMQFLSENGYSTITFDELLASFEGHVLPEKPVLITFDDGWEGQYDYAFPSLVDYGFKATFFLVAGYTDYKEFISSSQAHRMMDYGMEIGSHALKHRNLTTLSQAEIRRSVVQSKAILEEKIGEDIDVFCYPGGSHDSRVVKELERAGYKAAVTVRPGFFQEKVQPFRLKRLHVDNELPSFVAKVAALEAS